MLPDRVGEEVERGECELSDLASRLRGPTTFHKQNCEGSDSLASAIKSAAVTWESEVVCWMVRGSSDLLKTTMALDPVIQINLWPCFSFLTSHELMSKGALSLEGSRVLFYLHNCSSWRKCVTWPVLVLPGGLIECWPVLETKSVTAEDLEAVWCLSVQD